MLMSNSLVNVPRVLLRRKYGKLQTLGRFLIMRISREKKEAMLGRKGKILFLFLYIYIKGKHVGEIGLCIREERMSFVYFLF